MDQLADRLTAAADALTTVDRAVPQLRAGPGAFGVDDAGLPGRLGRELRAHWAAALDARAREAAGTASRLHELAHSVRETGRSYTDTDDEAAHRVRGRAR